MAVGMLELGKSARMCLLLSRCSHNTFKINCYRSRGNFGALSNGTNGSDATVGKGQNFSQTETVEDVWDDSPSTFSNG